MRKQKVIDILSDIDNFCNHKRKELFYKLEYDNNLNEEEKNKAIGAYKAYLDVEEKILHKIDRIRWNCD